MKVVVSHLTEIKEEALKRTDERLKELQKKFGVVVLMETRTSLGKTDIGKANYCKLEVWNGELGEWEELLVWAEGEDWTYGFVGRQFMEELGLTGIVVYEKELGKYEKERKILLFKDGEVYFAQIQDEEGIIFYDFKEEKAITRKEFKKELVNLLIKAGLPTS